MGIADPLSDSVKAIVKKQVEFYFCDSNIARDKFLMDKIESHPEGYVEIALLCSFTRMTKALLIPPGQSPEEIPNAIVAKVADALESSESLELSEDRQFVRRKVPLEAREVIIKQADDRTIYAKPLPYDTNLDTLVEFFGSVGKVKFVRMRRHPNSKDFKGSVFVEFDDLDTAKKVVQREDIEFEGAILRLEKKVEYMERKIRERKEPASPSQRIHTFAGPAPSSGGAALMEATPSKPLELAIGTVLRFKFKEGQDLSSLYFKEIKNSLGGRDGGVTFVDYSKGSDAGLVRYRDPSAADKALADSAEGLKIQDLDATLEKVEEQVEKEFHEKAMQAIQNAERNKVPGGGQFHVDNKRKSLNQRGRGRGGRFGKRGRMS